jgi:hypothetical protein
MHTEQIRMFHVRISCPLEVGSSGSWDPPGTFLLEMTKGDLEVGYD